MYSAGWLDLCQVPTVGPRRHSLWDHRSCWQLRKHQHQHQRVNNTHDLPLLMKLHCPEILKWKKSGQKSVCKLTDYTASHPNERHSDPVMSGHQCLSSANITNQSAFNCIFIITIYAKKRYHMNTSRISKQNCCYIFYYIKSCNNVLNCLIKSDHVAHFPRQPE